VTVATEPASWLRARQREQIPQAVARLTVIGLFVGFWVILFVARMPMPVPFLITLAAEAVFFLVYLPAVFRLTSARQIDAAHYVMLAAEIVFHTLMVYFLGGVSWLGAFAYVFGLIFTNTFLDLKRGLIYTAAASSAFIALALLDATGTIPHYVYLNETALRRTNEQALVTTILGAVGVFFSICLWVNWVGHQLRRERDGAVRIQGQLYAAHAALERANSELEARVVTRTSELQAANAALRGNEELMRATIESTADGILVVDRTGRVAYANTRFAEMWHISADVLASRDDDRLIAAVLDQLTEPDAFTTKVRELYNSAEESLDMLAFRDGRFIERYSRPMVDEGVIDGRVWSFRDVTEQKRAEAALMQRAQHDALTGCRNHAAVAEDLALLAAAGTPFGVVMADVDGMKAVNDTYGHQVGDAVLRAVAAALQAEAAIVGRYGGDEFLAVIAESDRRSAEDRCRNVLAALEGATVYDEASGSAIPVIASLGLAMYPSEAATVEDVIRLADNGMYSEKRERRMNDATSPVRGVVPDERAAKMIGEIVPLLTSPGHLKEKLRMVAHRLSVGAGYEIVRFMVEDETETATSTFARIAPEIVDSWNAATPHPQSETMREVLVRTLRPIVIRDLQSETRFTPEQRAILVAAGVRAAAVVPMVWQDKLIGVLSVATRREGSVDARDIQFLKAVADQVTAIIRMDTLVGDLQLATSRLSEARADTVVLLAAAAEAHEQSTGQHLHRVQQISEQLARELGYADDEVTAIGLAAVLHDIGKIRVPESILRRPARLNGDEWDVMKQHTLWGNEFLAGRPGFELAASVARCHHERWDGAGYPAGLAGKDIPEVAAIVTVADSFDAMTNDRPYRARKSIEWAVEEIRRCVGTQFSPRVAEALIRLYDHGELAADADRDAELRDAA